MDEQTTDKERSQVEEEQWIEDFLDGDQQAFEHIVRRYQDRVYHFCYRFLEDPEEAEDCAQEVFVRVFRGLPRFGMRSRLSTWIYRIALNCCRNRVTSSWFKRRRQQVSLNGNPHGALHDRLQAPDESPLARLARREREQLLHAAIAALPKVARTVIILRDIEGLSYKEVAEITGYGEGTVKSKLSRARLKLRKKLERIL